MARQWPDILIDQLLFLPYRYPDFIAPCLGIHPVQQLNPERSVTVNDMEGVEDIIRANQHRLFAIGEVSISLLSEDDKII